VPESVKIDSHPETGKEICPAIRIFKRLGAINSRVIVIAWITTCGEQVLSLRIGLVEGLFVLTHILRQTDLVNCPTC